MKRLSTRFGPVAVALVALAAFPPFAAADQPLGKLNVKTFSLTFEEDGLAVLRVTGTAEELGRCSCHGEIVFIPGADEGTLLGEGVIAFTAANGDLLVGVVAALLDKEDNVLSVVIHWRDAVTFGDDTTIESTGRFVDRRPPGIIAILIG
jgi:hypothetical protein